MLRQCARRFAAHAARRHLCSFGSVVAREVPVGSIPWVTEQAATSRQFLQGNPHLQLTWFLEDLLCSSSPADGGGASWRRLYGRIVFGSAGCEGPPGHAHGGSQAAVLDEGMGCCAWLNEQHVLAGEIAVRFLNPLPLDTPVDLMAEIQEIAGRKVLLRGEIASRPAPSAPRKLFATSTGTFIHQPGWSLDLGCSHV
jgi:acyl-coenzyme A thioesterase PaaI-like protein